MSWEQYREHPVPVLLLIGPGRLRRQQIARELAAALGHERLDIMNVPLLTAQDAREVVGWDMHARSGRRLAIIDLDGAGEQAQNILLKTLEEPRCRFILAATQLPLPTVVSRSAVCRLGAEPEREPTDTEAQAAARVAMALRAVAARDSGALDRSLRGWDAEAHLALFGWAAQCAIGRFRPPLAMPAGTRFSPGFGTRMLTELAEAGLARPRLAAQVVLGHMLARSH